MANTAAKEKDPAFGREESFIGNLGDDLISYEKAPRGTTPADLRSPPAIFLLGSFELRATRCSSQKHFWDF